MLLKNVNQDNCKMSFSESVSFHSASIFVFVSIFIFSLYEYQNLYLYECYCRMWSDCKKPLTESVLFHSGFSEYLSSKRQVHDNTECKSREHRLWKYKKVHHRYKYIVCIVLLIWISKMFVLQHTSKSHIIYRK